MQSEKTKLFIEKAIAKHGDRYCYSKSEYVGSKTNLIVVCHIHGDFPQRPDNHLSGQGCFDCNKNSSNKISSAVAG